MKAYLDSSVVLRKLQRERAAVAWGEWEEVYSSILLRVEVLRTIDRNRSRGVISDEKVADLITDAHAIFNAVQLVELSEPILTRASQSFPTPLATLDALHLSTALRVAELGKVDLVFLTHDGELALAARSLNLPVRGVS